jgi:hypothetical protein
MRMAKCVVVRAVWRELCPDRFPAYQGKYRQFHTDYGWFPGRHMAKIPAITRFLAFFSTPSPQK